MSVHDGCLVWCAGSLDTIPKGDHLRTILSKFCPQLSKEFRGEDFLNISPIRSYVKTMSVDIHRLGSQVVSSDVILKGNHVRTIPLKISANRPSSFRDF